MRGEIAQVFHIPENGNWDFPFSVLEMSHPIRQIKKK